MQQFSGMVVMDGMLTAEEWNGLGFEARVRYLATLDAIQLRAQASVLVAATGDPADLGIGGVIGGWIARSELSYRRAVDVVMTLA